MAHAEIIANGSFEAPGFEGNGSTVGSLDFWSLLSNPLSIFWGKPESYFSGPQDGNLYIGFGSGNGISQVVTIPEAGDYELSWYDVTVLVNSYTSPYEVTIFDMTDQVVAFDEYNAYTGLLEWNHRTLQANLGAADYKIEVKGTGPIGRVATHVDNFQLNPVSVPEPSTVWLNFAAGLGLIWHRRRRTGTLTMISSS